MILLGPIIRLQIQRSPLKTGEKPNRRYDPSPILAAERLRIGPHGALALSNGSEILDVHHAAHESGKNADGIHGISVGFTAHYQAMRERYGDHMVLGCAGENIIVETGRWVAPADAEGGFVILSSDHRERLKLAVTMIAHPCKPFSGFAHRHQTVDPEVLKATLQFLDSGTRGYYCRAEGMGEVVVEVGDLVALA